MYSVTYYKLGTSWFLDLPDYLDQGGDPDQLERIGTFHDFLEMASEGASTIEFQMQTEPFEGADCFELIESTGEKSGGYYKLTSFEGTEVDLELWFNAVIYSGQSELPQRIYFRRKR